MAMIEKRGPAQYRVRVRRSDLPKPISKTFDSRDDAEKWARRIESEIDAGKRVLFLSNAETRSMIDKAAQPAEPYSTDPAMRRATETSQ